MADDVQTSHMTKVEFSLPEFHEDKILEWEVHVSDMLHLYDMIVGRDILTQLEIDLHFSTSTCTWDSSTIPMRESSSTVEQSYYVEESGPVADSTTRIKKILEAKYEKADLDQIVESSIHLTSVEQRKLRRLLHKYKSLFDGQLGQWKGPPVNIELREGVKPSYQKAYPVPQSQKAMLMAEIERLVKIGVLRHITDSEWVVPNFVIPKKDQTVRFITDFRELNKRIKQKPYPIPKIQDLLLNLEGFQWATSLDLNMEYYHIQLTPNTRRLCTIVMPWVKYEYKRLPMGLSNSPDIFQENMSGLMQGLNFVRAYIDDLLVFSNESYDDHLNKVDKVLHRVQKAGLKVNATKLFFAKHELEYLGYWISRAGIQPLPKKVNAILAIAPPKNRRELRRFHHAATTPDIREYYIRRNGWNDDTLASIDWEGQTKAITSFTQSKQRTLHKYIHGWLPTGDHMKKRYGGAGKCPHCDQHETAEHLTNCKHEEQSRDVFLDKLTKKMQALHTDLGITELIIAHLGNRKGKETKVGVNNTTWVQQIQYEQTQIGRPRMWAGFLTQK